MNRKPQFENILKILHREKPTRPTPFELFLGDHILEHFTEEKSPGFDASDSYQEFIVKGYLSAGYDFATVRASGFLFETENHKKAETISLNNGLIYDENSFERYVWRNPEDYSTQRLKDMQRILPDGAKLIVMGPGGVLENVMSIVGYDNLCFMLFDEPELLQRIFDEVGTRVLKYYEMAVGYDSVGALISNDDWGFNTQTFMCKQDMEQYVFPWHKKIVQLAHKHNKPIILHSCGYFSDIIDPVVFEIGYDGKHSYEDNILPVEKSYDAWHDKIAVIGGIDVNFLATQSDQAIQKRCQSILHQTGSKGYAIGSGNSIADYVPLRAFMAMRSTWY